MSCKRVKIFSKVRDVSEVSSSRTSFKLGSFDLQVCVLVLSSHHQTLSIENEL